MPLLEGQPKPENQPAKQQPDRPDPLNMPPKPLGLVQGQGRQTGPAQVQVQSERYTMVEIGGLFQDDPAEKQGGKTAAQKKEEFDKLTPQQKQEFATKFLSDPVNQKYGLLLERSLLNDQMKAIGENIGRAVLTPLAVEGIEKRELPERGVPHMMKIQVAYNGKTETVEFPVVYGEMPSESRFARAAQSVWRVKFDDSPEGKAAGRDQETVLMKLRGALVKLGLEKELNAPEPAPTQAAGGGQAQGRPGQPRIGQGGPGQNGRYGLAYGRSRIGAASVIQANLDELKEDYDKFDNTSPLQSRGMADAVAQKNKELLSGRTPERFLTEINARGGEDRAYLSQSLRWEGYARMREGTAGLNLLLDRIGGDKKERLLDDNRGHTDKTVTLASSAKALLDGAETISDSFSIMMSSMQQGFFGPGNRPLGRGDVASYRNRFYVLNQSIRALDTVTEELKKFSEKVKDLKDEKGEPVLVEVRQPGGRMVKMPLSDAMDETRRALDQQWKERTSQSKITDILGSNGGITIGRRGVIVDITGGGKISEWIDERTGVRRVDGK